MTSVLDPRSRLAVVFTFSSLAVFIQDVWLHVVLLVIVALTLPLLGGDFGIVRRLRRFLMVFVVLIFVQSIFTSGGEVLFRIGGVTLLTTLGVTRALGLFFRLAVILLSSSILLGVNPRHMVQGLIQLKVPYEIAFMVQLAIRFLPLLQEELRDALTAIQLRGVVLDEIPWTKRIKVYSYLFLPVLAGVIVKAREISTSMEMRAFRATSLRTSYLELGFSRLDSVVVVLSGMVFCGFLLLQYWR